MIEQIWMSICICVFGCADADVRMRMYGCGCRDENLITISSFFHIFKALGKYFNHKMCKFADADVHMRM